MVITLGHWIHIPFGTILRITLRVLSGFRGIVFRILLRGLSGFRVTPELVVTAHPLLVPVFRYFEFSMYFFVGFKYIGCIVLWYHTGWCFVT